MVLFAHVTTRIEGRENDGMLRDVGGRGFPTIAFLDSEGDLIGKHNGGRDAAGFNATLAAVESLQAALDRVDKGDVAAAADVLIAEIKLGAYDYDGAVAARKELEKVSKEQEKALEGLMIDLEFSTLIRSQRSIGAAAFQEKVLEMVEKNRIPTGDRSWSFWYQGVFPAAVANSDGKLARRALDILEADPFFDGENDKYLDKLRDEVKKLEK